MNKEIRKVGIVGSGTMGSSLASHLANAGIFSIMLDIVPKELTPEETAKGLTLESPAVRNRIVNQNKVTGVVKMKPPGLMRADFADLIATGNLEDDLDQLSECDWVVEIVAENLEIKKQVLAKVAPYIKPGTIVTTNTSGISVNRIAEDLPEEFRKYWFGTHFFNPIRYMSLVEVIPCKDTLPEALDFLRDFLTKRLGKTVVNCNDTPCFIANRVGVAMGTDLMNLAEEHHLTISEVDGITGPAIGRPKTALFMLFDLVGLNIAISSVKTVVNNISDPEELKVLTYPAYIDEMLKDNRLGNKTGQGFYKRQGKEKLMFDPATKTYVPQIPANFESLTQALAQKSLPDKLTVFFEGDDVAAQLVWTHMKHYFVYTSSLLPEISDDLHSVDVAMELGYNYRYGPFRTWNGLDIGKYVARMEAEGETIADWVKEMLAAGFNSFYTEKDGEEYYYSMTEKKYVLIKTPDDVISTKKSKLVAQLKDAALFDFGDGVLGLEIQSKGSTLSEDLVESVLTACDELDKNWKGMVITSAGKNFCVGADLKAVSAAIKEGNFEGIENMLESADRMQLRLKYSYKPIVAAPFAMTLGGGCEISMHCAGIQAAGETYMGLVEIGVGLIPGAGGTKETIMRAAERAKGTTVEVIEYLLPALMTIGNAKTSSSGYDAIDLGYMRPTDGVSLSRQYQLNDAKNRVLALVGTNYRPPVARPFLSPCINLNGLLPMMSNGMLDAGFISEHD
ncbi:MAG: 3-hydroxyacyl-CoA dehydrogenase/enoyl-CoA hydratase family protein, partial [Clostridiales Family XIII bacterium]|nr:3-hydroxyacyl-CoA dehydrogenase/enoyl-CoA hydratase family protein [Clostridiales Family XIII bacterium]